MKKATYLIFFLLSSQFAFAQIKVIKLDKNTIPKSIAYKGHVVDAAKYSDADGDHLIVTTETGIKNAKGKDGFKEAELYAYHYKIKDGKPQLSWQLYDFVKDCDFDVTTHYLPNTFAITDLNKDGIVEIWLMYKKACRSDVSPADMKIIMYAADKKYAVRGTNRDRSSPKEYPGGEYTFDNAFKVAPATFRNYAITLWKKNIFENWHDQ